MLTQPLTASSSTQFVQGVDSESSTNNFLRVLKEKIIMFLEIHHQKFIGTLRCHFIHVSYKINHLYKKIRHLFEKRSKEIDFCGKSVERVSFGVNTFKLLP